MRIIKPGRVRKPEPRVFRGTCGRCGCQIEVDISDVAANEGGQQFDCPTEGCTNRISAEEVVWRGGVARGDTKETHHPTPGLESGWCFHSFPKDQGNGVCSRCLRVIPEHMKEKP